MELNVDDLYTVWDAVYDVQSKCYDIGIMLKVPVGTLGSIRAEYSKSSDQLREILTVWLKTATQRTWQTLADALKSRIVGEPKLASDIEAKYCQGTPGQASGQPRYTHVLIQNVQQQLQAKDQQVKQLQESQQCLYTLVMADSKLTSVGGLYQGVATDFLLSLTGRAETGSGRNGSLP